MQKLLGACVRKLLGVCGFYCMYEETVGDKYTGFGCMSMERLGAGLTVFACLTVGSFAWE